MWEIRTTVRTREEVNWIKPREENERTKIKLRTIKTYKHGDFKNMILKKKEWNFQKENF